MSRVRLEIDLDVLRQNFARIAERVSPCSVMAVLKANAYGLGTLPIARVLIEAGAARLGVADVNEGLDLKDMGVPIHILGAVLPREIAPAIAAGLTLPITDADSAALISREAVAQNTVVRAHALIDSGMGRLGIPIDNAFDVIRHCVALPGIDLEGLYSHFPMAYHGEDPYTCDQLQRVRDLLNDLASDGITFAMRHIANSDAVNNVSDAFAEPFNMVRVGINLYGAFDTRGAQSIALDSVLTLRSELVAARTLPAGTRIGYGGTHTLRAETRVGTVPAGYADGLPLALSNNGHVLVDGQVCPVLGRVSMDYTTIDLSAAPNARVGDDVICIGHMQDEIIRVEDWARIKGTHSYDIICSIGNRVTRCYTPQKDATP